VRATTLGAQFPAPQPSPPTLTPSLRVRIQARAVAMAIDQVWQHDKFPGQGVPMVNVSLKGGNAAGGAAQDTGAKLLVSNLHFNVTQQDVKVGGGVEKYVAHSASYFLSFVTGAVSDVRRC